MTNKRPQHILPFAEPFVPASQEEADLVFGVDRRPIPTYFEPTDHPPGTPGKIDILRKRAERNYPLWHRDDATYLGYQLPVKELPLL